MIIVKYIQDALAYLFRRQSVRLFRAWISEAERISRGPFTFVNVSNESDCEELVEKVFRALELIRTYDERRYQLVRSTIKEVVVADTRNEAEYVEFADAIVVQAQALKIVPVIGIAAMLVHESTHARLFRLGIPYRPSAQQRIERICLRNEIWFLRNVPHTDQLVEAKVKRL